MKKFNLSAVVIAASLLFSASAMAQGISKDEFKSGKTKISADYKAAKAACSSLSGNAKDICIVDAKGKEKVSKAELDERYQPSVKTQYEVRVAKAEATYALEKEKCDDLAGNPKDVCVKEAKAAEVAAKADAKTQMKTTDANATAKEKTGEARAKAATQAADARSDAATDKLDARYQVEKEKCDALAGAAKDTCMAQAKARFNK